MVYDLQATMDIISNAVQKERSKYHLTLGGLIEITSKTQMAHVVLDTAGSIFRPHSYRGYYSDLAFEPTNKKVQTHWIRRMARLSLNWTFEGYKGGDYIMREDTPLWVAHYGCASSQAIIGYYEQPTNNQLVLTTKMVS